MDIITIIKAAILKGEIIEKKRWEEIPKKRQLEIVSETQAHFTQYYGGLDRNRLACRYWSVQPAVDRSALKNINR